MKGRRILCLIFVKMPPVKKYFLVCFVSALSVSCTPYLYIPNTLNMPLAGNKGDVKGNLYFGSGGVGVQGSYAADSHLVVIANFAVLDAKGTSIFNSGIKPNTNDNFIADIGAGYFKKISPRGRLELLGGIGYGTANASVIEVDGEFFRPANRLELQGSFYRMFAQCDIGTVNENMEIGFGVRVSSIFMSGNYKVTSGDSMRGNPVLYDKPISGTAVLIEPCLNVGAGWKNAKLNFSLGYSGKITGMDVDPNYGLLYQYAFVTGGITINLFRKPPGK
jgi:hypothetical protein